MAVIIVNGQDTAKLIAEVNGYRQAGFVPACGLSYTKGIFYQPLISGESQVVYGIIDEVTDVAFQSGANYASEEYGAQALGEMLNINGRFVQAFGDGVSAAAAGEFDAAVLALINAATPDSEDYAGLTAYVYSILYASGRDINAPEYAGLRQFVQAVIDAQP